MFIVWWHSSFLEKNFRIVGMEGSPPDPETKLVMLRTYASANAFAQLRKKHALANGFCIVLKQWMPCKIYKTLKPATLASIPWGVSKKRYRLVMDGEPFHVNILPEVSSPDVSIPAFPLPKVSPSRI